MSPSVSIYLRTSVTCLWALWSVIVWLVGDYFAGLSPKVIVSSLARDCCFLRDLFRRIPGLRSGEYSGSSLKSGESFALTAAAALIIVPEMA